jgi:hypothetical protein
VRYTDGDIEDLSLKDLQQLARFERAFYFIKTPMPELELTNGTNRCLNIGAKIKSKDTELKTFLPEKTDSSTFDPDDYNFLKDRYLCPKPVRRIRTTASGRTVHRGRLCIGYIDNLPECKKIRTRVDQLLILKEHTKVYNILCQLREWEMNPRRTELFQGLAANGHDETTEGYYCVDLTEDESKNRCNAENNIGEIKERDAKDEMNPLADEESMTLHEWKCSVLGAQS